MPAPAALRKALPDELFAQAEKIASFIAAARGKVTVLSGAGLSTESSIPDYRGANGIYRQNATYKPITFQEFSSKHAFRQRYWARSYYGFPRILAARPNDAHKALRHLHAANKIHPKGLVTQNVDGLLQRAGTPPDAVIELHGTLSTVECLSCRHVVDRHWMQEQLADMNPAWRDGVPLRSSTETLMGAEEVLPKDRRDQGTGRVNPDGDLDLVRDFSSYHYPDCPNCRTGVLKPSVVYFGENVPLERKLLIEDVVSASEALLVVGTSLATFSSLRIAKQAAKEGKPIAIVNMGETRGDELASFKVEATLGSVLPLVADILGAAKT
ncbi:DHS-like NAD/FAD-binding domain-containing protein [Hyaloraphidium curvatum]|nr:DHS-like NAD/FAD-binding domain-containing protein [Hyaloraphidium curvatum]